MSVPRNVTVSNECILVVWCEVTVVTCDVILCASHVHQRRRGRPVYQQAFSQSFFTWWSPFFSLLFKKKIKLCNFLRPPLEGFPKQNFFAKKSGCIFESKCVILGFSMWPLNIGKCNQATNYGTAAFGNDIHATLISSTAFTKYLYYVYAHYQQCKYFIYSFPKYLLLALHLFMNTFESQEFLYFSLSFMCGASVLRKYDNGLLFYREVNANFNALENWPCFSFGRAVPETVKSSAFKKYFCNFQFVDS